MTAVGWVGLGGWDRQSMVLGGMTNKALRWSRGRNQRSGCPTDKRHALTVQAVNEVRATTSAHNKV